MPDLGPFELIIIVVVLLVLFGPSKVGDVGGALGRAVSGFRREANASEPGSGASAPSPPDRASGYCVSCGSALPSNAKFCSNCGTRRQAEGSA